MVLNRGQQITKFSITSMMRTNGIPMAHLVEEVYLIVIIVLEQQVIILQQLYHGTGLG